MVDPASGRDSSCTPSVTWVLEATWLHGCPSFFLNCTRWYRVALPPLVVVGAFVLGNTVKFEEAAPGSCEGLRLGSQWNGAADRPPLDGNGPTIWR